MHTEYQTSNICHSKRIINELVHQNVRYFCIAPGYRSTPLVQAVAEHPLTKTHVHFDERGLGFHALGFAKATQTPVCIIVTSGTAVGNLMPAVMEAKEASIPLIILSADRPFRLQNCGANQTTNQINLFGNFTKESIQLLTPKSQNDQNAVDSIIANAVYAACKYPCGPVQINCPFDEPLHEKSKKNSAEKSFTPKTTYIKPEEYIDESQISEMLEEMIRIEKGVIIVGSGATNLSSEDLIRLSEKLNWPILADTCSKIRHIDHKNIITSYDLIFSNKALCKELYFEAALHIGGNFVSKSLLQTIQSSDIKLYIHLSNQSKRVDPTHKVTHKIECTPNIFISKLHPKIPRRESNKWLQTFLDQGEKVSAQLSSFFENDKKLSESSLFYSLSKTLSDSCAYFIGNSRPIRDADALLFAKGKNVDIFANRGLSGIDGNIATAIGVAEGLEKPIVSIIGDMTALHDMNSFAMLKGVNQPMLTIVINNSGCGIFSFLPIGQNSHMPEELIDNYFFTSHSIHLESIAKMFDMPYQKMESSGSIEQALLSFYENPISTIVEVFVKKGESLRQQQKLQKELSSPKLKAALSLFS